MLTVCVCLAQTGCERSGSAIQDDHLANESSEASTTSLITSTPFARLQSKSQDSSAKRFEKMPPESTGIDFVNKWDPPEKYKVMIARAFSGAGLTIGDVDGDGRVDIFFCRSFGGGRLYRNQGDFKFEDATQSAGLAGDTAWSSGASFADIDNDGDLDLYVCGFDCANRLFINDGSGKFSEKAREFGLDFTGASIMMSFADYDNDGDLDGFLATNRHAIEGQQVGNVREAQAVARRVRVVNGRAVFPPDLVEKYSLIVRGKDQAEIIKAGQFGRLFRNNNDGTFSEVAEQSGIRDNGLSLSATWWDQNQDGWPDLYIANDFYGGDRLYRNNKDGTFTDVIAETIPHTPWFSMGSDVGDINNDGRIDFFATDMSGTTHYKRKLGMGDMSSSGWFLEMGKPRQYMRNAVYINTDSDRAMEAAHLTGLANTDWTWSPKFGDLDNDGDLDVFVANGMSGDWSNSDLVKKYSSAKIEDLLGKVKVKLDANAAFENRGDLVFENVGDSWGLDSLSASYGAALADLDNDGDLDVVTNDFDSQPQVLRNRSTESNRVKISLRGVESNRFGLGAMVRLEANGALQVRYMTAARGFMSTNEPGAHFGLGDATRIDRLTVEWPSGRTQIVEGLDANHHHTVTEDVSVPMERQTPAIDEDTVFAELSHQLPAYLETPFDDFAKQPLLPNQLSQLGPAVAVGDVDGDGDEDFYVGGPVGIAGRLCRNNGGTLSSGTDVDLQSADAEDVGALFFDADRDGDLDLYVVSGGVEHKSGDDLLRDRLYLNDGKGEFTDAGKDALPDHRESGSCVAAVDFDRDGDLDLFVGGRVVPGEYPVSPRSFLLVNESSDGTVRFTDQTDTLAQGLGRTGMVTSALWTDTDSDGWIDLMLTCEWGPVKLFRNESGKFVDATESAQLADRKGWWNGLSSGDFDNDGDIDYIATNFGLNTKYTATDHHPATIFYHDFDQPGTFRIVEAHPDNQGQMLPVRGRSCSSNAMPFIAKQCDTFHDFAVSSLDELYGERGLDKALRLDANELRSGLLKNDGQGVFTFEPLDRLAQLSPGFGAAVLDADADGNLDVVLAQNFYGPQRETGRMDGGLGLLMLGDGAGSFRAISPGESGVVIPGDAKSASVTDVDLDGVPDVVVSVNNGRAKVLGGRCEKSDYLKIELDKLNQASSIGAQVTAEYEDGNVRSTEVSAGGSYLSQRSAAVWFAAKSKRVVSIRVRWPSGATDQYPVEPGVQSMNLKPK